MSWRRLSVDLPWPRHPGVCQACGARDKEQMAEGVEHTAEGKGQNGDCHMPHALCPMPIAKVTPWQEHDAKDRPELICVFLCETCAKKIIDPHPRLYARMNQWKLMPFPGIMDLCRGCLWRKGSDCQNPLQKRLGGPGLMVEYPKPISAHISCSPRSASGFYTFYERPPTRCAGRVDDDLEGAE